MRKWATAYDIVEGIKTRQFSCLDVTEFYLNQLEQAKDLNAVVEINKDAREHAQQLDAKLKSAIPLPLHGLPVTIKCNLAVKGLLCTYGTEKYANFVAADDHTVVRRLKEAGCVILATTTMPELGHAYESTSRVHGITENPYRKGYSAGGSSSGEGALIAAGASPCGIGTDIAGSVRIPAHFCGCCGLKATGGRIPLTNTGGSSDSRTFGIANGLRCVGPMAQTPKDLSMLLPIISGYDGMDPYCTMEPYTETKTFSLSELNVAWYDDDGCFPTDEDTKRAVHKAVQCLTGVCNGVTADKPDCLATVYDVWMGIGARDGGKGLLDKSPDPTQPLKHFIEQAAAYESKSREEFDKKFVAWDVFKSDIWQFFNKYDVVICPAVGTPSKPHGQVGDWKPLSYTMAFNLSGNPSTCISPVTLGTKEEWHGMPVGIQVVTKIGREDVSLRVADYLYGKLDVGSTHPQ